MNTHPRFSSYNGSFVAPYLAVGPYPNPEDVSDIEKAGIRSIVNVVANCHKKNMIYIASLPESISWRHLGFWDGYLGDLGSCAEELSAGYSRLLVQWAAHELRENAPLLIHCMAGRGRSGNLAAILMAAKENISPEEAVEQMRAHRPEIGNFQREWGYWRQGGPEALVDLARTILEEGTNDMGAVFARIKG